MSNPNPNPYVDTIGNPKSRSLFLVFDVPGYDESPGRRQIRYGNVTEDVSYGYVSDDVSQVRYGPVREANHGHLVVPVCHVTDIIVRRQLQWKVDFSCFLK